MTANKYYYLELTKAALSNAETVEVEPEDTTHTRPLKLACSFYNSEVWVFIRFMEGEAMLKLEAEIDGNEGGILIYKELPYNRYEDCLDRFIGLLN